MRGRGTVFLALLATLSSACRFGPNLATLDARTLHARVAGVAPPSVEGAPRNESLAMRATYFPSTAPRARRRKVPLVVIEPLLFRRELLYTGGRDALVPYLQDEGFAVWLVGTEEASAPDPRAMARGIVATVADIARETGARRFDLLALSLGAEGALRALEPLTAQGAPAEIRRVVFLGGGFDFAYPHSFASRIASIRGRGSAPDALCTLDGDVGCARDFRAARDAVPWLAPLPTADDDALRPSRERFPFVTRFTHLPVLFVNGKADGIAPSEAMFPLYTLWGSDEPDPRAVPKLLFLAGRENTLGWDFDHYDLFAGDHAADAWAHAVAWLARGD
jgi:hypothetical protein